MEFLVLSVKVVSTYVVGSGLRRHQDADVSVASENIPCHFFLAAGANSSGRNHNAARKHTRFEGMDQILVSHREIIVLQIFEDTAILVFVGEKLWIACGESLKLGHDLLSFIGSGLIFCSPVKIPELLGLDLFHFHFVMALIACDLYGMFQALGKKN